MEFKKYERLPFAIIKGHQVWKRDRIKGWYSFLEFGDKKSNKRYCERSRFLTHPDFIGSKRIMNKKDVPKENYI